MKYEIDDELRKARELCEQVQIAVEAAMGCPAIGAH